eukprot:GHRR01023574.1.p1 GENE.GHRR01023574.1~~GHRR01023574.1.p1  ORF type:complete len:217 (+),score=89.90 GHRR01023574.1:216-866(+)
MSNPSDNEKPWRRLYHGTATEDNIQQQQPQQQQSEELTDLQQQLLTWYRRTCLVSGAGMAGSALYWNKYTKHTRQNVFLPPRAQSLPQAHVTAWRQKAQMKDALRTVGQQTLFITWVAALYFGVELGMGVWRYKPGDWLNTAAAGATAGAYLGARAPSSLQGRTVGLGGLAGGLLGAVSGWAQQQLTELAAAAEAGAASSSQPHSSNQPPGNSMPS